MYEGVEFGSAGQFIRTVNMRAGGCAVELFDVAQPGRVNAEPCYANR